MLLLQDEMIDAEHALQHAQLVDLKANADLAEAQKQQAALQHRIQSLETAVHASKKQVHR